MNLSAFRRSDPRRARRSLLTGLLTYLAAQVPLAIAAERYLAVRDPMYGDKEARLAQRIREKSAGGERPYTVLMLGSSRTGYGFHGKRVEQLLEPELGAPVVAYNFGVPASGPVTHVVYLKRLLEAGIVPDLLLVEILPSMLASEVNDPETGESLVPLEQFWFFPDRLRHDELALVERFGYSPEETRPAWRDTVLHPWHALRFQLLGRVMPGWVKWSQRYDWGRGCDACGWGCPMAESVGPEDYRRAVQKAAGEYRAVLADLKPGGPVAAALREMLATARGRGVPTALVLMPEGTEFRSWYPPHVRERVDAFLDDVSGEFGVDVIDARDWLPDSGFLDSHHMLRRGALAFSERLAEQELAPRLGRAVKTEQPAW